MKIAEDVKKKGKAVCFFDCLSRLLLIVQLVFFLDTTSSFFPSLAQHVRLGNRLLRRGLTGYHEDLGPKGNMEYWFVFYMSTC